MTGFLCLHGAVGVNGAHDLKRVVGFECKPEALAGARVGHSISFDLMHSDLI